MFHYRKRYVPAIDILQRMKFASNSIKTKAKPPEGNMHTLHVDKATAF